MNSQRLLNILAIATSVVVFGLFQMALISEANAFFIVAAVAIIYTGRQLAQRDGEPLGEAVLSMIAKPSSYPRRAAYFAYIGSVGIGALVMTQAVFA